MDLWVCYLLVADQTNQTYVGATNNAERRLRAHNRGVGAKRTRGQHWSHVLIISGFDCKKSCLSFEAGWKRLGKRRSKSRLRNLNEKFGTDYAYNSDTIWNRLLDLLYFVRTSTFIGTKFILNLNQNLPRVHPSELTIKFNNIIYLHDFPWPKFILIDVNL